ncbi:hypothetical protein ScPMuIL_012947 [Solemya velum]
MLHFRDGIRKIDYVLAYEPHPPGSSNTEDKKRDKQNIFETNLKKMGLELEHEGKEMSKSGKTCFVKVHAPWEVLIKYAEFMNMKMPLAENDMEFGLQNCWEKIPHPFKLDEDIIKSEANYFTAPFSRERVEQFVIESKETFFTSAQRSRITYTILSRCVYEENSSDLSKNKFGIKKLLSNGVYQAAFPLHDGEYFSEHSILSMGKANDRHLLYEMWAKPTKWYKYQPLDQIRDYFGEKIGIYFVWLGYYTYMLFPAAIVGLVAFFYGIGTLYDDVPSSEICDEQLAGNLTMCPLCDQRCSYWKLKKSCDYSRATYLFDNYATVAFAAFMALWASFFHEIWKRKQHEVEYDWDVAEFEQDEETVRPEFEAAVQRKRLNPINKAMEPYVPFWSKCCRYFTTITVLVFFFCLVLAALFGVIIYRVVIATVLYASSDGIIRERTSLIASASAAVINLIIILVLNFVYQKIALGLTDLEQHKTETEWEDAFTFKMYLFQFVNYYSSIVYIAFFKGRFTGRPGNYDYNLLDRRQEECDPAGCLIELCLQLAIIMVGKQAFNNFKELILPKLIVWFRSREVKKDDDIIYSRWEKDYNLASMPALGLFDEYLEMVIQYGFVTVFVAAFPLAPLFAFLNNVIEIRLDAYKFVTQWRRPFAARAEDIGKFFLILKI